MLLISALVALGMMLFATDCDKTLLHYDVDGGGEASTGDRVFFPSSAGSGKRASMDRANLLLLDQIGALGTIVCCSGMREATMRQRAPFLPAITYFFVENGGRLFRRRQEEPSDVVEVREYHEFVLARAETQGDGSTLELLDAFANALMTEVEGGDQKWIVDRNGYTTMIRVSAKGSSSTREAALEALIERIPPQLQYSRNLGYLDISLYKCGKRDALAWLIEHLGASEYLYMGDDDNDIEAAQCAEESFIVSPCSAKMENWARETAAAVIAADSSVDKSTSRRPYKVHTSTRKGHEATNDMLQAVLARMQRQQEA